MASLLNASKSFAPAVYCSMSRMAWRISRRYCVTSLGIRYLVQNVWAQPWLNRLFHHQINFAAKQIFEIELDFHIRVKSWFFQYHQNVNIAFSPRLRALE